MSLRQSFVHNLGMFEESKGDTPPGFSPSMLNVDIDIDGRLIMPGMRAERVTQTAMPGAVRGMWMLRRPDGTWALLCASESTLYRVTATWALVEIGELYGPDYTHRSGQVYGGRLFLCSGHGIPQVYQTELEDMDDVEGIDTITLPGEWKEGNWPSRVALINAGANERLVMFGLREDPTRVYGTQVQAPFLWTGSGSLSLAVSEQDGEPVSAVTSFHDLVVCGKRTKSVAFEGVNPPSGMQIIPFGMASQESIVSVGNDLLWRDEYGVISLSAALEPGAAAEGNLLSRRIATSMAQVPPPQARSSFSVWDEQFRRARFFGASRTSPDNDLHWDYYPYHAVPGNPGAWVPGSGIEASCAVTMKTAGGPAIILGGYDGHLYLMNRGYGADVPSHYTLPKIRLPRRGTIRILDWLMREGGENVRVESSIDGAAATIMPGTLAPSFAGTAAPARARKLHYGLGHEFSFTLRHIGGSSRASLDGLFYEEEVHGGR